MSCWCGHGPWHHYGYAYPPSYGPRGAYPPPTDDYHQGHHGPPLPPRRRRDPEELQDYLQDLEEELTRLRQELNELSKLRERAAGEQ